MGIRLTDRPAARVQLEEGAAKPDTEEAGVEEVQRRLKFLGRAWSDCEQQARPARRPPADTPSHTSPPPPTPPARARARGGFKDRSASTLSLEPPHLLQGFALYV